MTYFGKVMKKFFLLLVLVVALGLSVACGDRSNKGDFIEQSTEQSTGSESDVDSGSSDTDVEQGDSSQKPSPVPPISNGGDYNFN